MKKARITFLSIIVVGVLCFFLSGAGSHAASQTDPDYTTAEQEAGKEIDQMIENGTFDSSELTDDQLSYLSKTYGDDPQTLHELERQSEANCASLSASTYTHSSQFDGYDIKYGIDISEWQGEINWTKVKAAGIEFAFIRVGYRGYGDAGTLAEDSCYETNLKGAIAAGLDVGAYIYSQAITTAEAEAEADYILERIKGYDITLPVVMDYEYYGSGTGRLKNANLTKAAATEICNAFCRRVEQSNCTAMVYANKSMLNDQVNAASIANKYPIWLAHYVSSTDYTGTYSYWQYSSTGSVSGISGSVDMDFRYIKTPENVTNLSQTVSDTGITLSWGKVSGVYGYCISRLNTETGVYDLIGTTTGASQTTYTDTTANLTAENSYKVYAYYKLNSGNYYSADAPDVSKPVTGFAVSAVASSSVTLTWDALADVSGYEIARLDPVTGDYEPVGTASGATTTTYKDTGLSGGTSYSYRIRAYVTYGAQTICYDYGDPVSATTNPGKPTGVTLTADASSVTICWNQQAGVTGYKVYRKKNGKWKKVATLKGASTATYTHTGLSSNTTYTYAVTATYKKDGVSTETGRSSSATTLTQAAAVKGFTATAKTKTSVKLSWKKASNITGYIIYMKTDAAGASWKRVKTITSASKTSWTKKHLSSTTSYQFRICAYRTYKSVVYVGKTKKVSIQIKPSQVTNVSVKKYGSKQLLSWEAKSGVTGYYIYQYNTKTDTYKKIATVAGAKANAYIINKASSSKYTYHVTAYQKVGKTTLKGKRSAAAVPSTDAQTLTANASKLNVRKKANAKSKSVVSLSKGKAMTIKGVTVNKSGSWYKISCKKGTKTYTGYVSADYVILN